MEKDSFKTDVLFRKNKSGQFKNEVIAFFPYEIETIRGDIKCYERIGQHGYADYNYCVRKTVNAVKDEYINLYTELESLGYNLNVVNRMNHKKYIQALKTIRNNK